MMFKLFVLVACFVYEQLVVIHFMLVLIIPLFEPNLISILPFHS